MAESDDLERGIYPDADKVPDLDTAEEQGNLQGDDEDSDYSGNEPADPGDDKLIETPDVDDDDALADADDAVPA